MSFYLFLQKQKLAVCMCVCVCVCVRALMYPSCVCASLSLSLSLDSRPPVFEVEKHALRLGASAHYLPTNCGPPPRTGLPVNNVTGPCTQHKRDGTPAERDEGCGHGAWSLRTLWKWCVCVFYYCRTYYKAVRVGGGGEWRTCAMRDDEPRPVWMGG